jgi:hypothetical protein
MTATGGGGAAETLMSPFDGAKARDSLAHPVANAKPLTASARIPAKVALASRRCLFSLPMIVESIAMTASVAALAACKENGALARALHFALRRASILAKKLKIQGFLRGSRGYCKARAGSPFSF